MGRRTWSRRRWWHVKKVVGGWQEGRSHRFRGACPLVGGLGFLPLGDGEVASRSSGFFRQIWV
ncbi:hypothetical protein L484_022248 [Morus notabilis]|uniref:Uncharacterized protein n=1 Tax=Morus notabilis TaxID=981085 RepID=W9S624_9ROSA|nr:hypothetical protein L484_022248 [Morus notabilis]